MARPCKNIYFFNKFARVNPRLLFRVVNARTEFSNVKNMTREWVILTNYYVSFRLYKITSPNITNATSIRSHIFPSGCIGLKTLRQQFLKMHGLNL